MPEPSLSELTNIPSDASLGTSGLTDFVPKMHEVNAQIYDAAKFKANMDWQKYQQFLANFKDVVKQGDDIAKMDLAAPDREYLQKQAADIFSEIAKNPKSSLGGQGMFDIQSKLQKLQSDATQSKQDNMFDAYHRAFLDRVPDMKTDTNKAKVESYLKDQKLGTRQPYMLDAPDPEFDANKLFSGIVKSSTRPFSENNINPVDVNGQPLKGYIQTETGDEVNPKSIRALWNLALTDNPDTARAIKKRYDTLPADIKKVYDANGGVAKFFDDLGASHLQAQFPDGSYAPTKEGNYRFNKKSDLKVDPNYLGAEKLAEQVRNDRAKTAVDLYDAKTRRINATKKDGSAIDNSIKGNALNGIPLSDETRADGEYNLTSGAGKRYLGQLQQVMGDKVLPDSIIQSDEPENAISIKVKGGIIQSISVKGKTYDRQEIANMQKARDKEAKGSEHMQFPLEQAYLSNSAVPTSTQKQTSEKKGVIPKGTILIGPNGKKVTTNRDITEEEATKAGFKQ